jgi:type II secretory pathway pseudopilin PulG
MKMKRSSGQAVVIVLLIMAVVLTIGLSVISQAVNDVKISQKEEESARAFSAAEAGVEQALIQQFGNLGDFSGTVGSAQYNVSRSALGSATGFVFPNTYLPGEAATLYLVPHDSNGNFSTNCGGGGCYDQQFLDICWGNSGENQNLATTPAMEVALIYIDGPRFSIARRVIDPNAVRRTTNNFSAPTSISCNVNDSSSGVIQDFGFLYRVDFRTMSKPQWLGNILALRIKLLYNTDSGRKIGANTINGATLPAQGIKVGSVGAYGNSRQKVEVTQLYPQAPSVFDYAIYSEGTLVK